MKLLVLATFSAGLVGASTVTLNVSGSLGYVGDPDGHFNNLFSAGDTYTGTLTYDFQSTLPMTSMTVTNTFAVAQTTICLSR